MLFIVLYSLSAITSEGRFKLHEHFFCNLFQGTISGHPTYSLSEIFAILALLAISVLTGIFFFNYSKIAGWNKQTKIFVRTSGIISACLMGLIFLPLHDELILLSAIIGFPAVVMVLMNLRKQKNRYHTIWGVITVIALVIYNGIFYLNIFEFTWPILQKIAIILCLIWINILFKNNRISNGN